MSILRRSVLAMVTALLSVAALTACDVTANAGGGDDNGSSTGGASAGGNSTTKPSTPAQLPLSAANISWTDREIDVTQCAYTDQMVTGIRAAAHDGFDRVVIDLTGDAAPSCYRVFFDPNPVQDGSGFPVDLGGKGAIRVEVHGLGQDFPQLAPGFTVDMRGKAVDSVRFDTFFEAIATFFIATPSTTGAQYSVSALPGRLVVDVKWPSAGVN
jgi:hypothetical protein